MSFKIIKFSKNPITSRYNFFQKKKKNLLTEKIQVRKTIKLQDTKPNYPLPKHSTKHKK